VIWSVFFVAWTVALLVPIPSGAGAGRHWLAEHKFYLAKGLHVTAYAVLAVLSAGLRLPCRFRWIILFVIMVHATVTELLQQFVETRTGLLSDVGLDHLGIALGLLVTWKRWSDPA
jgi:VanZ family protein